MVPRHRGRSRTWLRERLTHITEFDETANARGPTEFAVIFPTTTSRHEVSASPRGAACFLRSEFRSARRRVDHPFRKADGSQSFPPLDRFARDPEWALLPPHRGLRPQFLLSPKMIWRSWFLPFPTPLLNPAAQNRLFCETGLGCCGHQLVPRQIVGTLDAQLSKIDYELSALKQAKIEALTTALRPLPRPTEIEPVFPP
jgi:hypothetical protein